MRNRAFGVAAFVLLAAPAALWAQSQAVQQVRQTILDSYAFSAQNLRDAPDTYARDGALEFWSSGGLLQVVPADAPRNDYLSFSLTPKHIRITMLADDQVAVASFYAEGAFEIAGQSPVSDYLTRVTQVFVMEDGQWKVRASHFSPILGGSGTRQRALEN